METRDAAIRWAATWERCWQTGEAEPIAALYSDDAVYSVTPFREPNLGRIGARAYLRRVLAEETQVAARFAVPIVDGARAAVQWWASYIEEGREITLAGTSVLEFDADGLVTREWDAWNEANGRLAPAPGWSDER